MAAALVASVVVAPGVATAQDAAPGPPAEVAVEADPPLTVPAAPVVDTLPPGWPVPPTPGAVAWLLLDADTGQVLGERRGEERRSVASTVKVLTALTTVRRTELSDVVTVGDEVLDTVGANVALQPGDEVTVEQLLLAILVRSGNDAAEALAAHVAGGLEGFLDLMRADAAALGLEVGEDPPGASGGAGADGEALRLVSVSGLDDDNRLSPRELAELARAALEDPDLRPLLGRSEATLPRVGTDGNRNLLIGAYPGATGVKTGFTEAAGNSLIGSARRDGRELIVVVLDAGEDPARFEQAARLLDHGFDAYTRVEPSAERQLLVAGGRRTLTVVPAPVTVPVDAEVGTVLRAPVRLEGRTGPRADLVVDGLRLGTLPTTVDGEPPAPVDGAAAVGRAAVDGVHAALRGTLAAADPDA